MTDDQQWVAFLQWALPQLQMRWTGFRKVRSQVFKRIDRRMRSLQISSLDAYRQYLQHHPGEWSVLDTLCRITISRFYRDRALYAMLAQKILPKIVDQVRCRGKNNLRLWSAGCASGEEPYSLALLWKMQLQKSNPDINLQILATDVDSRLLQRARTACYPFSSLQELPECWRTVAFEKDGIVYCMCAEFKAPVLFVEHDIRAPFPANSLHLILCRNLIYTYFDIDLQRELTRRLQGSLLSGGLLVLGAHEALPVDAVGFEPLPGKKGLYTRV